MHVLHLNTDSGKMSKSKGEFLTVSLLESKGYDPLAYRFFCLGSHYRRSLVFSFENLDNAVVSYNKLIARIAALKPVEGEEIDRDALNTLKAKFREALDNDLNTSLAITALYNVLKSTANTATKRAAIKDFDTVLALNLLDAADALAKQKAEEAAKAAVRTYSDDPEIRAIEEAIDARAAAKKAKNYAEADRIRHELLERGIVLTDTSSGTTWAKKA
jgi:cysteinyl-tRNA synthetase